MGLENSKTSSPLWEIFSEGGGGGYKKDWANEMGKWSISLVKVLTSPIL